MASFDSFGPQEDGDLSGRIGMGYGVTVFFYLVIGIGVAFSLWASDDVAGHTSKLFPVLTAPFFWPVYIPLLLSSRKSTAGLKATPTSPPDGMEQFIDQVEMELATALRSLDGWAENVLDGERDRFVELQMAWRQQANRIRELDALLAVTTPNSMVAPVADPMPTLTPLQPADPIAVTLTHDVSQFAAASQLEQSASTKEGSSRAAESEQARRENNLKLKSVRAQLHDDLMATLSWVRELATMIHLAKYTGAPASRAKELVKQIADAVGRLSDAAHRTTPL